MSSLSLRLSSLSLVNSGVSSVDLLEGCDCVDRVDLMDFCEVGRDEGVLEAEPHVSLRELDMVRSGWCKQRNQRAL